MQGIPELLRLQQVLAPAGVPIEPQ